MLFAGNPYKTHTGTKNEVTKAYGMVHKAKTENDGNRCAATVPVIKTKQGATKENSLGIIGKDEVPSPNLESP